MAYFNIKSIEQYFTLFVFVALVFLPAAEVISRLFGTTGVVASSVLVQHFTLWIGFAGAVVAARRNKLLSLTTTPLFEPESKINWFKFIGKVTTLFIILALAFGSWELVKVEMAYPVKIAPLLPRWGAQMVMPVGFILIAIHLFMNGYEGWKNRGLLIIGLILIVAITRIELFQDSIIFMWVGIIFILFSLYKGAPIFIGLGGLAILFFWQEYTPLSAIPAETYRIVVSPTLPTIPLFTLAGYILAESKASERLVKLFRALFGWIPGGTPVVLVLLCGFFTALTGGSGVTILALGGLLFPLLIREGYSKHFSLGLITVAGSLGLLFPPSLPLIIYGVTAAVSVKAIFLAGIIPGFLRVAMIGGWAVWQGKVQSVKRHKLNFHDIKTSLWEAKWEAVIPFFILFGIFGGYTTLVETAAMTTVYVFIVEVLIYNDLNWRDIKKIILDCSTLIGGVLIILGVAMGLTSYMVDAQIPMQLLAWVKTTISSKIVFLLMLNIFLLAVGCMMDIFSAIIIVVPLITPLGAYFGIDPIHLAIIFIANLELGFLTPPVGMNLFLSAYRFDEDMPTIYKSTLPFFMVMLLSVLIITYIPILSTWAVK
ncbi:MAG: TRAP transporter large permease subunit [Candidatus Marinimicrobia bacterium]|nr:TRAP transporter large permease subunit [Candidatus Neomarinimicrobiota bacterium]MBT4069322.1 TRAP transporter large permease subunit [Candidatus Neomarinimicrobiota bacterium]MBT4269967.1 TRAP transporter large permease subunit [Candidatus Neomarinimicrobiota bacterium]MBT4372175.1 TRAP transporter large permease subunit [Candidatus Neomarinimicrobiota bacterium]MBT4810155.1 TRAP transporter large permease subunit [Candidatus Neomarinimicrobiota bacterium]